jgi:acetylornithine deacetylase
VPGAPGERPAVDLLAARLAARDFATEVVGPPDRPSLVASYRGRADGPALALNGHLDTVGAGGMAEPFSPRIEGDRLYGRGSCDMKAGVAAMVAAAESAAAAGAGGDVVLALVADEEHASLGTTAVLAHLQQAGRLPDACIVGEPTWLDLIVAHLGFTVVEVELRGRAAHSSRPQDGVNAVTHLGRLLAAVEAFDARLAARQPHPHAGIATMQATVARGGSGPFVLADRAGAVIERRTVPGDRADGAVGEVESIVAALARDDPAVDAACREVMSRDAWEMASGDPLVERLVGRLEAELQAAGRPVPRRLGAPYWMESALWERAGVPTIVIGPAGGGLHTDVEWVELSQVRAYATALTGLLSAV